MNLANSKIICVLGPPRSGTSLTTMLLNRLGTFFGPTEHLDKPYDLNPKGSWEHVRITEINEELLARFDGSWHEPPRLEKGWEQDSQLDDLKEQAASLIRQDFAEAPLWGWKDPPTCFTLPFWQAVLPPIRYVICFRNPLDVARSLERRDGFSLEKGFYLWLLHIRSALQNTVGQPRISIFSEQWIGDWDNQLRLLYKFLDGPGHLADEIKSGADVVIDKTLWHYRSSTESLARTLQIYASLMQQRVCTHDHLDETLQDVIELIGPEVQKHEASKKHVEDIRWKEKLQKATTELDSLISPQERLILVDQQQLGYRNPHTIPFLEKDGQYWGLPPDDATAIREFERLRSAGASFIVFAWPAFWWLDYYRDLNRYLRSKFLCVVHNERLVAFDLRSDGDATHFSRR